MFVVLDLIFLVDFATVRFPFNVVLTDLLLEIALFVVEEGELLFEELS